MVPVVVSAVALSGLQQHQQRWTRVSAGVHRMDDVVFGEDAEFGFSYNETMMTWRQKTSTEDADLLQSAQLDPAAVPTGIL